MIKVVKVESFTGRLGDEKNLTSYDLEEVINWYYENKDVMKVDFVNFGLNVWAYITIQELNKFE